jgi:hypothetical protein
LGPRFGADERPTCDPCFTAGLQATRADEGSEVFARSIIRAAMFNNARRGDAVLLEARFADEWSVCHGKPYQNRGPESFGQNMGPDRFPNPVVISKPVQLTGHPGPAPLVTDHPDETGEDGDRAELPHSG